VVDARAVERRVLVAERRVLAVVERRVPAVSSLRIGNIIKNKVRNPRFSTLFFLSLQPSNAEIKHPLWCA
jgi:hypothetical protein